MKSPRTGYGSSGQPSPIRISIDNALVDNGVMFQENTIESASMNVSTNLLQSNDMISILSLWLAQRYAN